MNGGVLVVEAVEWREPAPSSGSQAQVFRLIDGRFVVVKFPENPQGEVVLANEFLSCQVAELLQLPVNRAVLVSIDERLLRLPRQNGQIPAAFSAGIRCGMIRFENAEGVQPGTILSHCKNSAELHSIVAFEQLVGRGDGQQLLMYPSDGAGTKDFAAYDYGFAFGGQPNWSTSTLSGLAPPSLPTTDPLWNRPYQDGSELESVISRLRTMTTEQLNDSLARLHPPRWGITPADLDALGTMLYARAKMLIDQYDQRYKKQMEVF